MSNIFKAFIVCRAVSTALDLILLERGEGPVKSQFDRLLGTVKPRIALISPSKEVSRVAREASRFTGEPLYIGEAILDDGVSLAKTLEAEGISAIISRAPTGVLIKKAVSIPVVLIQITAYDIVRAIYEASKMGRLVGYIGYKRDKLKFDFNEISLMLGVPIRTFFYDEEEELEQRVDEAKDAGCDVVVGTGVCIADAAARRGLGAALVGSSREAVVESVRRAQEIIELIRRDEQQRKRLRAILDFAYEGIIGIDEDKVVSIFNPAAERLLGVNASEIVGRTLEELKGFSGLKQVVKDGEAATGEIVKVGDNHLVVNRVPVKVGSSNMGTVLTFQAAADIQSLEQRIRRELAAKGFVAKLTLNDIVGQSAAIRQLIAEAEKFARTDSTILITGESGVGKEILAQGIHQASRRKAGPFVAVNCAALPENLLESELFGYEEGAFTGARKRGKPGLFELAHTGTIFLDEIGEITPALQARLLRVVQEKEVMRVGGDRVIPVDVRILAATNHDLQEAVKQGKFRRDLYFRLDVLRLEVPPLRDRKEDIPLLVKHFLHRFNSLFGCNARDIPSDAILWLQEYDWPGNVRELENFVEKYVVLDDGSVNPKELVARLLNRDLRISEDVTRSSESDTLLMIRAGSLEDMEKQIIDQLSKLTDGNKSALAELLGVSRTTIWRKLKEAAN